jgi:hypothetical protein
MRIIDMQARIATLEQRNNSLMQSEDMSRDVEGAYEHSSRGGSEGAMSMGLNRRGSYGTSAQDQRQEKVLSDLEKYGVKAGPGVAKAVSLIDAWTLVTGRFLRNYPLLRLAFVVYLFLIHIWAIVLLAMQTHSLEGLDSSPSTPGSVANIGMTS